MQDNNNKSASAFTVTPKEKKTRKRAIAKALQLKGHSDFAPVNLAYYQHFVGFCSKILRFGKFRVATTNAVVR